MQRRADDIREAFIDARPGRRRTMAQNDPTDRWRAAECRDAHVRLLLRGRHARRRQHGDADACSDELRVMTDDGSYGTKGVVTAALDELVEAGNQYDLVITIGPLIMMKFVVKTCQKHGLKSIVSMNPIMIDGTGMCGGCRLTVGGETKFACVDGPDFDGDLVDFDEAMARGTMYRPFEARAREAACNLLNQEVK